MGGKKNWIWGGNFCQTPEQKEGEKQEGREKKATGKIEKKIRETAASKGAGGVVVVKIFFGQSVDGGGGEDSPGKTGKGWGSARGGDTSI